MGRDITRRDCIVVAVQLAMKHARTVERYEAKLQATLREKQQACEAASKQEMEHYRLHGHAQCKIHGCS